MSFERELQALRKRVDRETADFQANMERFIANEGLCRSSIFDIVESYAAQARLEGVDSFTICYIEPTEVHMEELLIIEEWAEERKGCEFDVEETRENGTKTLSITINLSE